MTFRRRFLFDFEGHIHTVCLLMQFHIPNLIEPIDITDLTEAAVMKDINLSHIPFRYPPALGAIQQDGLNVTVVKPDLGFKAVLLGTKMIINYKGKRKHDNVNYYKESFKLT